MSLSEERKEKRKKRLEKIKGKRLNTKKARLQRKREAARKQRKYEKELDEEAKRNAPKIKPIRNADLQVKKENAQKQLEENLQILKALEEEYEKEMAAKKDRNEELESQGYTTMQEKMDAINQQALEGLRKIEEGHKSGDYGEFENSLMKNWETEKQARETISSENAANMLKEAQQETADAITGVKGKSKKKKSSLGTITDLFGGSASCVAKDKEGNVLHSSGGGQEKKN